jgi:hypothetical protein
VSILSLLRRKKMRAEYSRKFGKDKFRLVGITNTKASAENEAERIRNRGRKSRVVKLANGYAVYQG